MPSFLLTTAPHFIFRNIQPLVYFVLKINCAGGYWCIKIYQKSEDSIKCNIRTTSLYFLWKSLILQDHKGKCRNCISLSFFFCLQPDQQTYQDIFLIGSNGRSRRVESSVYCKPQVRNAVKKCLAAKSQSTFTGVCLLGLDQWWIKASCWELVRLATLTF